MSSYHGAIYKSKYAGALDVTIEEICDRMNTVRNGIAHSRLDLNLEAIHLSDLKIIEELLYAMAVPIFAY